MTGGFIFCYCFIIVWFTSVVFTAIMLARRDRKRR
jgi:hypothetical protein